MKLPEINSVWLDKNGGMDNIYKYKGIYDREPFIGQMHFVLVDYKTGAESEGGMWLGKARFKSDMISAEKTSKKPCCKRPTVYPILWCDDCGYEAWSAARDAKEKTA